MTLPLSDDVGCAKKIAARVAKSVAALVNRANILSTENDVYDLGGVTYI